jgi:hypothetical protein
MPRRTCLRHVVLAALTSACALVCAVPQTVRADGDPASDVLLVQDVFYPYQPKVSPSLEKALEQTLKAVARAGGTRWKVAIIGASAELGLVPQFWGHPQAYAGFLDREISFNGPQALVTVMPAGLGVVPAADAPALAAVRVDAQHGSDGLTRSAVLAVLALARHEGHPIATPSLSSAASKGGGPGAIVFALPVAVLALAGVVAVWRGRRNPWRERD